MSLVWSRMGNQVRWIWDLYIVNCLCRNERLKELQSTAALKYLTLKSFLGFYFRGHHTGAKFSPSKYSCPHPLGTQHGEKWVSVPKHKPQWKSRAAEEKDSPAYFLTSASFPLGPASLTANTTHKGLFPSSFSLLITGSPFNKMKWNPEEGLLKNTFRKCIHIQRGKRLTGEEKRLLSKP